VSSHGGRLRPALAGLAAIAGATPAAACGGCVFAMADMVLPPITLWCVIAVTWFLASAAVASILRLELPLQPKLLVASLVAAGGVVLSGIVGPLALLPLGIPPLVAFVHAGFGARRAGERGRRAILLLGAAHVVAATIGLGLLVFTLTTRTDADVIVRWPFSPPARERWRELAARGQAGLPELREIVERADGMLLAQAALQLAKVGEPAQDAPRVERALERLRADRYQEDEANDVMRALVEMKRRR
jgi:hypothetical protein